MSPKSKLKAKGADKDIMTNEEKKVSEGAEQRKIQDLMKGQIEEETNSYARIEKNENDFSLGICGMGGCSLIHWFND